MRKTWASRLQKRALVTSNDSRLFLYLSFDTLDRGSSKVRPLDLVDDTYETVKHILPVDMIAYKPS